MTACVDREQVDAEDAQQFGLVAVIEARPLQRLVQPVVAPLAAASDRSRTISPSTVPGLASRSVSTGTWREENGPPETRTRDPLIKRCLCCI